MAAWLEEHGARPRRLRRATCTCSGRCFLERFPGRVVNTHSAPLPDFPGARPIEDVLEAGVPETAATVHYVDEGVDSGPVIAAERVPVLAGRRRLEPSGPRPGGRAPAPAAGRPRADLVIKRALISVYDKEGLEPFARGLAQLGVELVASGGTAAFLQKVGIAVTPVEDLTETPELLGGRVKTLHPRIHAAILARRDRADDRAALEDHAIEPFDLVCVNLYPFEDVVSRRAVGEQDAVEMIDIGGPAMLRAAAKNFAHVAPGRRARSATTRSSSSCAPAASCSLETRRRLAAETFAVTAAYEAAIANWFTDAGGLPGVVHARLRRRSSSSPTARTRTSGPRTTPSGARGGTCSRWSSSGTGASSRSTT